MHAVARSAVGDVLVARLALEAVVRVDERGETLGGEPVLLVEDGRLVAGRAGDLGHLRARHRRARIRRRQDAVLPVVVGLVQTGASVSPRATSCPWIPSQKSFSTPRWHWPQVLGMSRSGLIVDLRMGDRILCAVPSVEWQSLQVAATYTPPLVAWPCTLLS